MASGKANNIEGDIYIDGNQLSTNTKTFLTTPTAANLATLTTTNPVIQRVSSQTGEVATGTTVIPLDDTIPQNNEGDEYLTLAITPKNAANILRIDVCVNGTNSTAGAFTAALFQDTTADALAAAVTQVNTAGQPRMINFTHTMAAGTTSATTFKVRMGCNNAGTTSFNGISGGRIFGGVMASSIVITEYAA